MLLMQPLLVRHRMWIRQQLSFQTHSPARPPGASLDAINSFSRWEWQGEETKQVAKKQIPVGKETPPCVFSGRNQHMLKLSLARRGGKTTDKKSKFRWVKKHLLVCYLDPIIAFSSSDRQGEGTEHLANRIDPCGKSKHTKRETKHAQANPLEPSPHKQRNRVHTKDKFQQ